MIIVAPALGFATVRGRSWVRLLERAFGDLPQDVRLYPHSAHTYRNRWDKLLTALRIPSGSGFTPGGLRGGGAVHAYEDDVAIPDIMWRMRLKDVTSLAHYLQEVAVLMSLRSLPPDSQLRLKETAALFDALFSDSE